MTILLDAIMNVFKGTNTEDNYKGQIVTNDGHHYELEVTAESEVDAFDKMYMEIPTDDLIVRIEKVEG